MDDDNIDDLPDENPLFLAVGKAISEYAQVEFTLASILQNLLRIDFLQAHGIFFTIQNVRSRNELYQTLLKQQFTSDINKYWDSCSLYLQKLAVFRNALAHWHRSWVRHVGKTENDPSTTKAVLSHPVPGSGFPLIGLRDLDLFMSDCRAILIDLTGLVAIAKERPDTLPEKFLRPKDGIAASEAERDSLATQLKIAKPIKISAKSLDGTL